MKKPLTSALFSLAALLAASTSAHADARMETTAREVFRAKADAVLQIRAVLSVSMTAGERAMPARESTVEFVGTVVDASGLMVASCVHADPASAMNGRRVNGPTGEVTISATTEVKELFVVMPDGVEVPARMVMKDAELDLVFLQIDMTSEPAKGRKLTSVDLGDAAPQAATLDEIVVLGRFGKTMDFAPRAYVTNLVSVIRKPRLVYFSPVMDRGVPVFDVSGKVLGFSLVKISGKGGDSGGNGSGMSSETVILPVKDVVAQLARARKAAAALPPPESTEPVASPAK